VLRICLFIIVLFWPLGCAGIALESVAPKETHPGGALTLRGTNLGPPSALFLTGAGFQSPLRFERTLSEDGWLMSVDADVTPGIYDLLVEREAKMEVFPGAISIAGVYQESPCSPHVSLNSQISFIHGLVVFARTDSSGEVAYLRVPIDEVQGIGLSSEPSVMGEACSSVYFLLKDGQRRVFADEIGGDMTLRGEEVAKVLGLEWVIPQ
jgi:hypothetical protein